MAQNYNRGYLEKVGETVVGSLQIRVREVNANRQAGDKMVTDIRGYGFYAGPSGIPFALGEGLLNPENGAVNVNCTAWDKTKEFVDRANVQPGDTIRVYGQFRRDDFTRRDGTPGAAISVTIHKVEIDFRRREAPRAEAPVAEMPEPELPEPVDDAMALPEGIDLGEPERLPFR